MNDRAPVRLDLLHMLPNYLLEQGIAPTRVFAPAGIEWKPDGWSQEQVARGQIFATLKQASRLLGDPLIGLKLASRASPQRLGLAGMALFKGPTLRDCLNGHARLMPTILSGSQLRLVECDGKAFWSHRMLGCDENYAAILSEGAAAFAVEGIRRVLGESVFPMQMSFAHRGRLSPTLYEDHFQAPVRFGSEGGGSLLTFDAALLDRPNICLDLKGQAEPIMPLLGRDDNCSDDELIATLVRMIGGMMVSGDLSLVRAAETLGYSPRSLQRRLSKCGVSFEDLVEGERQATAKLLLKEETIEIGAISRLLSYSHPAHFIRAFRRWEGMSPSRYRQMASLMAAESASPVVALPSRG